MNEDHDNREGAARLLGLQQCDNCGDVEDLGFWPARFVFNADDRKIICRACFNARENAQPYDEPFFEKLEPDE